MKLKSIFVLFIINFAAYASAPKQTAPSTLLQELSKETWVLSVCVSTFKKNTLQITDPSNKIEHKFPLCSSEEAITITEALNSSFTGLPKGYVDCLLEILTGQDDTELLKVTEHYARIINKDDRSVLCHHIKKNRSIKKTEQ